MFGLNCSFVCLWIDVSSSRSIVSIVLSNCLKKVLNLLSLSRTEAYVEYICFLSPDTAKMHLPAPMHSRPHSRYQASQLGHRYTHIPVAALTRPSSTQPQVKWHGLRGPAYAVRVLSRPHTPLTCPAYPRKCLSALPRTSVKRHRFL